MHGAVERIASEIMTSSDECPQSNVEGTGMKRPQRDMHVPNGDVGAEVRFSVDCLFECLVLISI